MAWLSVQGFVWEAGCDGVCRAGPPAALLQSSQKSSPSGGQGAPFSAAAGVPGRTPG